MRWSELRFQERGLPILEVSDMRTHGAPMPSVPAYAPNSAPCTAYAPATRPGTLAKSATSSPAISQLNAEPVDLQSRKSYLPGMYRFVMNTYATARAPSTASVFRGLRARCSLLPPAAYGFIRLVGRRCAPRSRSPPRSPRFRRLLGQAPRRRFGGWGCRAHGRP